MHYKVVVFGVKDTSENIIEFIQNEICPVDLVITISPEVTKKNEVSGYKGSKHLITLFPNMIIDAFTDEDADEIDRLESEKEKERKAEREKEK